MPDLASIALRAAANSFLVTRLAFSKGNSFEFFISLPFTAIRGPGTDDAIYLSVPASCENRHQHAIIRFAYQPLPDFSFIGVFFIGSNQGKGVIESRNRLIEGNSVLENIAMSFLLAPLEFHVFSIYRKSALLNELRVMISVWEFLEKGVEFREISGMVNKCENPRDQRI